MPFAAINALSVVPYRAATVMSVSPQPTTYTRYRKARKNPGNMAAAYSFTTDWPATAA